MIVIEVFARDCEPRWRPTPSRIELVMSQTFCERCGFPVPMHWLHAGGGTFPLLEPQPLAPVRFSKAIVR